MGMSKDLIFFIVESEVSLGCLELGLGLSSMMRQRFEDGGWSGCGRGIFMGFVSSLGGIFFRVKRR